MNSNRKIGQLLLVEVNKQKEIGNLFKNVIGGFIIWTKDHEEMKDDLFEYKNKNPFQPIIICDDEIKNGEWYYDIESNTITNKEEDHYNCPCKKILVLPNQFSQEFLQAIVDGKVKDGDKVEVDMEFYDSNSSPLSNSVGYWILKLRKDGTAIIHPYKESVEEAAERYALRDIGNFPEIDENEYKAFKAGAEWQKNQKK